MPINVNITLTDARVSAPIRTLTELVKAMALDLQKLTAEVAETTTVIGSTVTLLQGLRQQIADLAANQVDPATQAALDQLAADLDAGQAALAAAVVENTPAESV